MGRVLGMVLCLSLCLFSGWAVGDGGAPFDGTRFSNTDPTGKKSFLRFLKWKLLTRRGKWPSWVEGDYGSTLTSRVGKGKLSYNVVNHATVLIQVDGVNILTDPVWSERVGPWGWFGPKRVRNPGLRFESLPPIDLVVISHNHYDHMDAGTIARLEKAHSPVFLVGLANGETMRSAGARKVVEMDWWQETEVGGMKVSFVPARHWSQRGPFDRNKTLWGGFYFKTSKGGVYFAGDTGYGSLFHSIRERLGAPVLSFLPVGAYKPHWFMKDMHMDPAAALRAHRELGSRHSVGIHFGTFRLGREAIDDPIRDLNAALSAFRGKAVDFRVPHFGETLSL